MNEINSWYNGIEEKKTCYYGPKLYIMCLLKKNDFFKTYIVMNESYTTT